MRGCASARGLICSRTRWHRLLSLSSIAAIDLIKPEPQRLEKLRENTKYFRAGMTQHGFDLVPGEHPIVPVMLYDAPKAKEFADGCWTKAFTSSPSPTRSCRKEKARIRAQMSAAHEKHHLDKALAAFKKVG